MDHGRSRARTPRARRRTGTAGRLVCLLLATALAAPLTGCADKPRPTSSATWMTAAATCPAGLSLLWSLTFRGGSLIMCGTKGTPSWARAHVADLGELTTNNVTTIPEAKQLCAASGRIEDYQICISFADKGVYIGVEGSAAEDFRELVTSLETNAGSAYCKAQQWPTLGTTSGVIADGDGAGPDGTSGGPTATAQAGGAAGPSPTDDGAHPGARTAEPLVPAADAGALLLPDARLRESIAGFSGDKNSSSTTWGPYYSSWVISPPDCRVLETATPSAPDGFALHYGTGTGQREFFKQQALVLPDRASAIAAHEAFRRAADRCSAFTRDQGGGRRYTISVANPTDVSADYPTLALTTSASGNTSWTSHVFLVRFGNALVWVNGGTYRSASTYDVAAIVRADLTSHLRAYMASHT